MGRGNGVWVDEHGQTHTRDVQCTTPRADVSCRLLQNAARDAATQLRIRTCSLLD